MIEREITALILKNPEAVIVRVTPDGVRVERPVKGVEVGLDRLEGPP